MPKVNRLTEKQKNFCKEYIRNNGNATQAYLYAYDSKSETSAAIEASKLLKRDDITEYLRVLNKPIENKITNERVRKRNIIWERIEACIASGDDAAIARYMDILNKLDGEYINITKNLDDKQTNITKLDTSTLEKLVKRA
jgi:phage terminase small subunit